MLCSRLEALGPLPLKHLLYSWFQFIEKDALFPVVQHGHHRFQRTEDFRQNFILERQDQMR